MPLLAVGRVEPAVDRRGPSLGHRDDAVDGTGEGPGHAGDRVRVGAEVHGRDDRVLEINPRLTSSFAGLTRLFAGSLVKVMIEAAEGGRPTLPATAESPGRSRFQIPSVSPARELSDAACQ